MEFFAKPTSGIQLLQFIQDKFRNIPPSIRGSVDGCIMESNKMVVFCLSNIHLKRVSAQFNRFLEGYERILRSIS